MLVVAFYSYSFLPFLWFFLVKMCQGPSVRPQNQVHFHLFLLFLLFARAVHYITVITVEAVAGSAACRVLRP